MSAKNTPKTAIFLINLGSPDAPSVSAVRRYLAEFLRDKRVVDLSRWLWLPILYGIILRTRPQKTAQAYQSIWTTEGSPLIAMTNKQAELLRQRFCSEAEIYVGMRYGNPSIGAALEKMQKDGIDKVVVLPLYPQYSRPTTESVRDKLTQQLKKRRYQPTLAFIEHYYQEPLYIKALAKSISDFQQRYEHPDKLLFSYHGIPQRYADNGDCYPQHCEQTTRLVVAALGLSPEDYLLTYQSRFGREQWLQPYTDETLMQLAKSGVSTVHILSPAFAADCLETLEELEVENRDYFESARGEDPDNSAGRIYRYIPALNDSEEHIDALEAVIRKRL
ncbi:MAG: ferrochelatase [Gammaproteobacteria bacterium]|nr:MAG: ferrochelatase [Gammaproteobacteria bacterium]